MLARPQSHAPGASQSSQSSGGPQFHVLLTALPERKGCSMILNASCPDPKVDRKSSQGASTISPSPSLFLTLLVCAMQAANNKCLSGVANCTIPWFRVLKSQRKSNSDNSAGLTLLFTCCVTLSEFIQPTNRYLLSIYYTVLVYTLVRERLTQNYEHCWRWEGATGVCTISRHSKVIRHIKEKREELTLINRHLFAANRPSGMSSKICCSAETAQWSTRCSCHFLKYSCSSSTALSHLSSHVWG